MSRANDTARRRAPRLSVLLEGSLSGRADRKVLLVDLSATGCLVQCDARLDPGAILDLRLVLDESPLTAKVRVVEASLDGTSPPEGGARYLAGLEFLALAAKAQDGLRRFLEAQRRKRSADAAAH